MKGVLRTSVSLLLLFSGCSTITPAQSAGLRELRELADRVTAAYGVEPVRVVIDRNSEAGGEFYDHHRRWISVPPSLLERQDRLVIIAPVLAAATLDHRFPPGRVEAARAQVFAAHRRAVEILVKFLGMNTRQAVDQYTGVLLKRNEAYAAQVAELPKLRTIRSPRGVDLSGEFWAYLSESLTVPPCDLLRDLWSYFAMAAQPPTCERPKS